MPYIKQDRRLEVDPIVGLMAVNDVIVQDLSYILLEFCKRSVNPSYNNYKNFCGELRQCATEIERKVFRPLYDEAFELTIVCDIEQERREQLEPIVELMIEKEIKVNGDLNYVLFKYCKFHVEPPYTSFKDFCGKLRRIARDIEKDILAPYEDEKERENGSVY